MSLIAVNRPLSAAEEAPFAHALASLATERRAPLCIVAGALRLNVGGEGVVFQHAINGAAPLDLGRTAATAFIGCQEICPSPTAPSPRAFTR